MQMASKRKYAYYLRGNQIAIIEEGLGSGVCSLSGYSNQTTCEAAGGTWTENATGTDDGVYRSPTATVADGLEIEYAYSPRYILDKALILGRNKVITPSWFIDESGYLNFTTVAPALGTTAYRLDNDFPWTQFSAGIEFVVRNSDHWNGLHKVQAVDNNGGFSTYTKASHSYGTAALGTATDTALLNVHSDGYIYGEDASGIFVNNLFKVGDYVFLPHNSPGSGDAGHYKVTSITEVDDSAESSQKAYLGTKYFLFDEDDLDEFQSGDSHFATDTAIYGQKVIWDPCYLILGVNSLNDESDTIDLPEYLTKALVYYVKAKMAEDQGDIERMQYNEVQFRALMNRYENSRIWGSRRIAPGVGAIR